MSQRISLLDTFFVLIFPKLFNKGCNCQSREDFEVSSSDEVVIRPGEISGGISVNTSDDIVPEVNETFSITVSTSDNVTIFSKMDVNITIINNGKNVNNSYTAYCTLSLRWTAY